MEETPEPLNLKFLRQLVTVLTVVMIGGLLVVVGLLVTRFYDDGPAMPESITLPDGAKATAFTRGDGWYAVVTKSNNILIFDAVTGQLKQEIEID